jgi:hypothetical protein
MEKEGPERGTLIFVDSSYFIARVDRADRWHDKALKIPESTLADGMISDYVVLEAVTVVGRRKGGKEGVDLYEFLTDNFEIVYVDDEILKQGMQIYLKHDGLLSVADAVTVEIMRRRDVKDIVSFDSDFDRVPGITRIH